MHGKHDLNVSEPRYHFNYIDLIAIIRLSSRKGPHNLSYLSLFHTFHTTRLDHGLSQPQPHGCLYTGPHLDPITLLFQLNGAITF